MVINKEQQQVINELDRNILLLASAGTGKTNTLAYRVAHIIESGRALASHILCMTFTNKACGEMKGRIMSLAGSAAKAVEVSTFHSFCFKIIQEEAKRDESLFMDVTIFDDEDCKELYAPYKPHNMRDMNFANIIAMVKEYRSYCGFYTDNAEVDYRATIEWLKANKLDALEKQFMNYNQVNRDGLGEFLDHGYQWMTGYDEALQAGHGVDFMDLITGVHRLFQDETVRERWRSRYNYIAVDEMQDTGVLEYYIMKMLWFGNHVLLCGDYFQTIYEWRGSDPFRLLADFESEFSPMKVIFYENYRSNRTLFTMAFKTLKNMFPQLVSNIYNEEPRAISADDGPPVRIYGGRNEYDEGKYIFDEIRRLPKDANIGVLVRDNGKAQRLSALFNRFNQDYSAVEQRNFMIIDEFKFFRRQEIKDVMAYFKLLMNRHDGVSAKRIIKRYVAGIGEERIRDIESVNSRKAGLKLTDFMDMHIFEEEPYARLLAGLDADNVVVYDVESTGVDTTTDEIIQIAGIRIDKTGKVLASFDRLIKPTKSVGDSEAVHGFSDAQLAAEGEPATVVIRDFLEFARGAVIVGHNVNYDISILTSEMSRHNMGTPQFAAVYDTLDIFRRFYPNLQNHKLGFLSSHFPINHEPTHNAMDDILATAQLLVYAVKENIIPTETQRMALISQYKSAFATIASQMATLRRKIDTDTPTQLLAYIMNNMGVLQYYQKQGEGAKVEYIRELYRIMEGIDADYVPTNGRDRLTYILQMAALTAGEPTQQVKGNDRIPIITVHQAKGSEFDHVYLAGMSDDIFPSYMAMKDHKEDEEKRLFYVALTRTKQELVITYAKENYRSRKVKPSPFLDYLPNDRTMVEKI